MSTSYIRLFKASVIILIILQQYSFIFPLPTKLGSNSMKVFDILCQRSDGVSDLFTGS